MVQGLLSVQEALPGWLCLLLFEENLGEDFGVRVVVDDLDLEGDGLVGVALFVEFSDLDNRVSHGHDDMDSVLLGVGDVLPFYDPDHFVPSEFYLVDLQNILFGEII